MSFLINRSSSSHSVDRACSTNGRREKRVEGMDRKARRKEPLVRPRRRWEDGIKMDLKEIGWWVRSGFTWLRIGITAGLL
jgi:hypothetical protein